MNLLRENTVFWSKLGFCYNPPRLDENGCPICFFSDFEQFKRYHRDFYRAGIKLHTSILFSGWIGDGKYDYTLTDQVLDAIFSCGDDLLYIPRIKMEPPVEWLKNNPEEVFVYENGPRDLESIRALIGTDKHDMLGYDSPEGYYLADGRKDDRPNIGGVVSNQSFSSRKWLEAAREMLNRLFDHIGSKRMKRIPAIHIAYGVSGECCLWGRFGKSFKGDFGIAHRRRYGREIHLDDPEYQKFIGEINVEAAEYFCRTVKERYPDKLAGVFYGYMLYCANSDYTGYLNFDRILASPYIDFICGPKSYIHNAVGEPGGELGPAQSINLRKLWLDEIDIRTHLKIGRATTIHDQAVKDMRATRYLLWREFAKTLAHDSGMWWMDLGGGWYDSPEIMEEIAKIEKVAQRLRKLPHRSVAEVLALVDEHDFPPAKLHQKLYPDAICMMNRCGLPIDVHRVADLGMLNLAQYKAVVLLHCNAPIAEALKVNSELPNFRQYFTERQCRFSGPPESFVYEDNRFMSVFYAEDFIFTIK